MFCAYGTAAHTTSGIGTFAICTHGRPCCVEKLWVHVSTAHPVKNKFLSNVPFHVTLAAAAQLHFFHSELGPNY